MPSAEPVNISYQDNRLLPNGDLNFLTVSAIYTASLAFFKKHAACIIDFAHVNSTNSAGLALIIEWQKLAKELNCQLSFINIPASLHAIAKAADMDDLF